MNFEVSTERLKLKVLGPESAPMVLKFYQKNKDIFEKYEPILGDNFYTIARQKNILDFEHKNILKLTMMRYWIFNKNSKIPLFFFTKSFMGFVD